MEISPVPAVTLTAAIEKKVRSALDRIAGDIPFLGLAIVGTMRAQGKQAVPAPQVVLVVRGVDLTGPEAEILYWWAFTDWNISQENVDLVVRAEMAKLREYRQGLLNDGQQIPPQGAPGFPASLAGRNIMLPPDTSSNGRRHN